MSPAHDLTVGDVVVVRTPLTWASLLIRVGCWLHGRRAVDHVAVVVEEVESDVLLIEGRPSGVGYTWLSRYQLMSDNRLQAKTPEQRADILRLCTSAVNTPYDWPAIFVDALECLGAPLPRTGSRWGRRKPRATVCSAMASWAYTAVGLEEPAGDARWCTPWDWDRFCEQALSTWYSTH
jgi:hypothetical protein